MQFAGRTQFPEAIRVKSPFPWLLAWGLLFSSLRPQTSLGLCPLHHQSQQFHVKFLLNLPNSEFLFFYQPKKIFTFFFFLVFLELHSEHMEVPRLGLYWSCSCQPYAIATAMRDPSCVFTLHHSSRQCWILSSLSKTRDWTQVLIDTSQVRYHWATMGIPKFFTFKGLIWLDQAYLDNIHFFK